MPTAYAPTVRQRRIGSALRKARLHRNLTLATASGHCGRSAGWLSVVENGLHPIAPEELANLLDYYEVPAGPLRDSLLHLASHTPGKWVRQRVGRISAAALDLVSLEEDAAEICDFECNLVPGLLQTPAYTQELVVIGAAKHPHNVKTLVDFRRSRQQVFFRPDPPSYQALIAEAVLYNMVGGDPAILRAQIRRLSKVAQLKHVDLRVLPQSASAYLQLITPCHLISLRPPGQLTVSITDLGSKSIFVEDEDEVATHQETFELIRSATLSRTASLELIDGIASQA
ncbi:helix-turn-helix domain-containing protein [Actinomadura litoris]|uniref:helix-turn-helix domain-containing protein n=1 Tax=Actinomadura litoris TaxID=2678616 RepID=UPI001FA71491|nr:helix-turn-helix transcriptional regulator [Actinomadura litoris]